MTPGQQAARSEVEAALPRFEGLVKRTAREIVEAGVELEYDDVAQLVRVKVWRSIVSFSSERAAASRNMHQAKDKRGRTPLERYVFGNVLNLRKDIEKRPRRYNASLDEIRERPMGDGLADDWFDDRFLSIEAEQVYWEVEEESEPLLPSTLTPIERQVALLRFNGAMLQEIDRELGLSRAQREEAMRSVRAKLADWRPSAAPERAPMRPLPGAEPAPARARGLQAA